MIAVEVSAGRYLIRTHEAPDGRVFIEIQRQDDLDAHDHPVGPEKLIVVDDLFKEDIQDHEDDSQLPKLADLRGTWKGCTGGLPVLDFLKAIRGQES